MLLGGSTYRTNDLGQSRYETLLSFAITTPHQVSAESRKRPGSGPGPGRAKASPVQPIPAVE